MSYLGRGVDKISNIETLDNITFNGASSYTLQKGGVNFVPTSAAAILISIDGVVQSGNFTVSSSTIDFGTAVAGTSTCNFIIHLGTGVLSTPSDGSVSADKLASSSVTRDKLNLISDSSNPSLIAKGDGGSQDGYIQLNCRVNSHGIKLKSPPHSAGATYTLTFPNSITADQFLKTDGSGNLSFAAAGGSNTPNFYAYRSGNQSLSNATTTKIQFNAETYDTANAFDSSTNYRFTPQTAGKYHLLAYFFVGGSSQDTEEAQIYIYKNGSNTFFYEIDNRGNTNGYNTSQFISAIVEANGSSDYFEVYARVKGAGTKNLVSGANQCWFQGYKLIE